MSEEHNIDAALFKLSNEIKSRRLNIDARVIELCERQKVLLENNEARNEFAHKLWKGYKVLGLVNENYDVKSKKKKNNAAHSCFTPLAEPIGLLDLS